MSSVYDYIVSQFPNVEFTGGSDIHASFFREQQIGTYEDSNVDIYILLWGL